MAKNTNNKGNISTAIKVSGLSKSFRLPTEKANGVKQAVINMFKGVKGFKEFKVLQDIDFEVMQGDFFGIVGRNGSGKSTLLKLISQIYTPDKGGVQVNGKLVPFIELGVGFNMELTGRENIYMNGALLGFSNEEINEIYEDIVEFAELPDFMEQKLKNYSSGMMVRLAFSIAIRAEADILVLDEVLAVGDEAFQRKCNEYFAALKKNKKTVILVTHDMGAVRKFCNKALLLKDGHVVLEGSPEDVANKYTELNFEQTGHDARIEGSDEEQVDKSEPKHELGLSDLVPHFKITPVSSQVLTSDEDFVFDIEWEITEDIKTHVGISIIDTTGGNSGSVIDDSTKETPTDGVGKFKFRYTFPCERFNNREFTIRGQINKSTDEKELLAYLPDSGAGNFAVRGRKRDGGLLRHKGVWVKK